MIRLGGQIWEEVPSGEYIARCTKVDPDWRLGNTRKLTLYFTITEGQFTGARARLFFARRYEAFAKDTGADFGHQPKLFSTVMQLFPEELNTDALTSIIDPIDLFFGKIFQITVELKNSKNTESPINAVITNISHPDVGF